MAKLLMIYEVGACHTSAPGVLVHEECPSNSGRGFRKCKPVAQQTPRPEDQGASRPRTAPDCAFRCRGAEDFVATTSAMATEEGRSLLGRNATHSRRLRKVQRIVQSLLMH